MIRCLGNYNVDSEDFIFIFYLSELEQFFLLIVAIPFKGKPIKERL